MHISLSLLVHLQKLRLTHVLEHLEQFLEKQPHLICNSDGPHSNQSFHANWGECWKHLPMGWDKEGNKNINVNGSICNCQIDIQMMNWKLKIIEKSIQAMSFKAIKILSWFSTYLYGDQRASHQQVSTCNQRSSIPAYKQFSKTHQHSVQNTRLQKRKKEPTGAVTSDWPSNIYGVAGLKQRKITTK